MKKCADKPCPNCPWYVGSSPQDIPRFSIEKMRKLANTAPPRDSTQDGFRPIMACHKSKEGVEFACAGYIAVHGIQNINVRLLGMNDGVDIGKVLDNCEELDLHGSFHEMLDEYEIEMGNMA